MHVKTQCDRPCTMVRELVDQLDATSPELWARTAAGDALDTFHETARRVPAYADFLRRNGVRAARIRTPEHLADVPLSDRASYMDQYPIEDLVWDGKLANNTLIGSALGAEADRLWPLSADEMPALAIVYELMYFHQFEASQRSTLLAICLDNETWTAGVYTLLASQYLNQRGYAFSIVSPGADLDRLAAYLSTLAPKFEQTIVAAAPAFASDILTSAATSGAFTKSARLRFMLAGENFPEPWRDRLAAFAGFENSARVATSLLGSPDAGLMGFETPVSIEFRRAAAASADKQMAAFGDDRLPMLFNYIPTQRWFEEVDQELIVTARRALPLVRYNTHIDGRLPSVRRLSECLGEPVQGHRLRTLPFVTVH